MKRIVISVLALGGLVGGGSAGVYFAHEKFLAAATTGSPSDEPEQVPPPRDMRPMPIPLANATAAETPQRANPFRSASAERVTAEDRYPARRTAYETSEEAADTAQTIERDDDQMPGQGGDPLGLRDRQQDRYADTARPDEAAAADEPAREAEPTGDDGPRELSAVEDRDAAQAEADSEPRTLGETPTEPAVDRFGRSLNAAPAAVQPARDEARDARRGDVRDEPTGDVAPQFDRKPASSAQPAEVAPTEEGTGRPGDPQLSGAQAPTLAIEKLAPAEIQIGKPAKFVIKVTNTGSVAAQGVEIRDSVPKGTQLIETTPTAERGPRGALVWQLGTLKPGDEQTVELQLMPTAEGEIGSVATVHFAAQASVRTVSTKPMLAMDVSGPAKVLKGQPLALKIKLSNPGTGAATGIVLSESVPEMFAHESGSELEFEVGTLKPGESRELELELQAATAGVATNVIVAQGEGNLRAEARAEVEVVAPQLQVALSGPKRRYLERKATHTISITNPGTATAKEIELVAVLPQELKFVEANNGGQFDAATHSVYWGLEELPPQETGTVTLTTLPLAAGEARVTIKASGQMGLKDEREEVVAIEGLAAVNFQIADKSGPIEVGGQATYEIRVTNQGSKAATNVRLAAQVPRELKLVSADGPVRYKIEAQRIIFEPLRSLAPKSEMTFSVTAQALGAGDLRVQVQLASDDLRDPITKEENTRVFGNE